MTNTIKELLNDLNYNLTSDDYTLANFFNENGYCILPKSDFIESNLNKYRSLVDNLIKTESWRGGWEGKEEYMKFEKYFNAGANRLANLFNKDPLFLKLLTEKNLLKTLYAIYEDNFRVGALDMREPMKGRGLQDLHIDWMPKKTENEKVQNIVAFIFLDDTNKDNGSMRIVPKTHKKTGWIDEHLSDKKSHPNEEYLEVKKASIVLMHCNLWHSGTVNHSGDRRRVLYMDIRTREIPQLLNQKIYLNENTMSSISEHEKYLLGVRNEDPTDKDRVYTAGNLYRKIFNTTEVTKIY